MPERDDAVFEGTVPERVLVTGYKGGFERGKPCVVNLAPAEGLAAAEGCVDGEFIETYGEFVPF